MQTANFKFIFLPLAAERLGVTRNELLQMVAEGKIKPFTGSGQQAVFRTSDIDRLAAEMRGSAAAEPAQDEQPAEEPEQATGRQRRRDPVKLIGTRISQDSRWAEISDADLAAWLDALERVQFERVRKVAGIATERLNRIIAMLDEQEKRLDSQPSSTGKE
jgi:hypothetical protein